MKKNYIALYLFFSFFFSINAQTIKFSINLEEQFSFKTYDNKLLSGILTIPEKNDSATPIVIFVCSPLPSDRNYHGLFSEMADSLAQNGIASLRFDNRSFSDSTSRKRDLDKYTMYDVAKDVHDAYLSLRNDSRFTNSPIGLVGHSEGGASCAIEAAQNSDISFIITLSTMGISGKEIVYYQSTLPLAFLNQSFSCDERNDIIRLMYNSINIIDENQGDNTIKRKLEKYYNSYYTSSKNPQKEFGKLTKEQFIDTSIKAWMTPRKLCYIKYNPEKYFSKLKCPVLVICGMEDDRIDWKSNLDGIERIFLKNNKQNYKIVSIPGVNHSYEETNGKIPSFVSMQKKDPSKKDWGKGFQELNLSIYEWINNLK